MAENASLEVTVVLSIKRWIIHEIVSLVSSGLVSKLRTGVLRIDFGYLEAPVRCCSVFLFET
jgi:hypothetical protein